MANITLGIRAPDRIAMDAATASLSQGYEVPYNARIITVQSIANDGQFSWVGTDDTAMGSEYITLQSGVVYQIDVIDGEEVVGDGTRTFVLASPTTSSIMEVMAEE